MPASGSRPPRDPRSGGLGRALLASGVMLAALAWALIALRLTRDPVGGIDELSGPLAFIQFAIAALGAVSAWGAMMGTHAQLRTGQGEEPGPAFVATAVLFAIWALLVLPGW